MSNFLLSQIIVGCALFFDIGSQQFKRREHLIIGQMIAGLLISIHFFLLEVQTAGWMFAFSALRLAVSLRWRNRWSRIIFIGAIPIIGIFSYTNYLSIIGVIAALLMATGAFSNSDKHLRLFLFAGACVWTFHNILAMTPVGIFTEFLFASSAALGYYRFYIRQKPTG